jgi:hypothetical protein
MAGCCFASLQARNSFSDGCGHAESARHVTAYYGLSALTRGEIPSMV